jgi:class 3 adenylate cyclase
MADAPAPETLEGERKMVTALFADIKGSTELERNLDPEEARAIVDPVLRLMMDAVHRYGGYVAQSTGDGIFALKYREFAQPKHAPKRADRLLVCRSRRPCRARWWLEYSEVAKPRSVGRRPILTRLWVFWTVLPVEFEEVLAVPPLT